MEGRSFGPKPKALSKVGVRFLGWDSEPLPPARGSGGALLKFGPT